MERCDLQAGMSCDRAHGCCCSCRRPMPARKTRGKIVEEVVARVNNEVITRGDLDRAEAELLDEIAAGLPDLHARRRSTRSRGRSKRTCCAT